MIIALFALNARAAEDFYELSAKKINGEDFSFSELRGKKAMIVNTASKCGYTYQYGELQQLYENYGGENFEIIGFPANNFGNQEPGTNEEIEDFCTENYGVSFQMMEKISVKGADMHPVYKWLTQKSLNGYADSEVMWNFQKYLINEDGTIHAVISTTVSPLSQDIVDWISEPLTIEEIKPATPKISAKVFANPAKDKIKIMFMRGFAGKVSVSLYAAAGEKIRDVYSGAIENGYVIEFDTDDLSSGAYLVKIQAGKDTISKKVIIEK